MNIIIASVSGGIGNQLFQYAHARNIALNSKTIIIIDASWFTSIPDALTKRSFNLSALVDNLHVIDSKNISRSVRYGLKFLGQVINLIFKKNIYAEITEFKAFAHQRVDLKKLHTLMAIGRIYRTFTKRSLWLLKILLLVLGQKNILAW